MSSEVEALIVPKGLEFARLTLIFAWKQYDRVQEQKSQCELLLKGCHSILLHLRTRITAESSEYLTDSVRALER
jgi:hypothetical protein